MSTTWSISWLAPRAAFVAACAATVSAAAPAALSAQQQQLPIFTWAGSGAGRVDVTLRGGSATAVDANGRRVDGQVYVRNAVPRRDGTVEASASTAGVTARVVQQPSASNGYTTVVRIVRAPTTRDVRVTAYWTGDASGGGDRGGVYGNHRGTYGARDDDRGRYGVRDDRGRRHADARYGTSGGYGDRDRYSAGVLHWSGNVDGEVRIRWDGQTAQARTVSGKSATGVSSSLRAPASSRGYGQVAVELRQGRGEVVVAQQPTARNGYTAVIRVIDPSRGYGHYDFDVVWR